MASKIIGRTAVGKNIYFGTAADLAALSGATNGDVFIEVDGTKYQFNGSSWSAISSAGMQWDSIGASKDLPFNQMLRIFGLDKITLAGHVALMLIGSSHVNRNFDSSSLAAQIILPMAGFLNWANWSIGAPFVFQHRGGVSGDLAASIFSRLSYIPASVEAVAIMSPFTNDLLAFSDASTANQIDAEYARLSTLLSNAVNSLNVSGKKVLLSTEFPNSAYSVGGSRAKLLFKLNTFTLSLVSPTVFVGDLFTSLWDATQPTGALYAAGMSPSDGTHVGNAGAFTAGTSASMQAAMRGLYSACTPNIDIYDGFQPVQILYGSFRSGTGGTAAVKTNGTGNLADGWRSINNAGTAVFTLDNTELYVPDTTNMVGPWVSKPTAPENFWQTFNISSAALNDNPRLRYVTLPANSSVDIHEGAFGGDQFFMEVEARITGATNLRDVMPNIGSFWTNGTTPADLAFMGTAGSSVSAGYGRSFSLTDAIPAASWRAAFRTPVMRLPENINGALAISILPEIDMIFAGAGAANISFAQPRVWHKAHGRIG